MINNVLLVEDNSEDELLTIRAIKRGATEVNLSVVRDGAEALEHLFGGTGDGLKKTGGLPQLILLDLKLPKVDGIEVLRRIRSDYRTRFIPVVVLSSSNEEHDIDQCYEIGANSYLRKDVDYEKFTNTIELLKMYWLVLNEVPRSVKYPYP